MAEIMTPLVVGIYWKPFSMILSSLLVNFFVSVLTELGVKELIELCIYCQGHPDSTALYLQ
jgi:hypothetical protein